MKKRLGMLLVAMCTALVIAAALPGSADAKSKMNIDLLMPTYVDLKFDNSEYMKEIQIMNVTGKKVVKTETCYYYVRIPLKKNTGYYVRYREVDNAKGLKSAWSNKVGICTLKYNLSLLRSSRKVKYKAPKLKGIKSLRVYMSTKKTTAYKKVKTLKPNKSFSIGKFRGKKLKKYVNYYYYTIAIRTNGAKLICPYGYWYIY